MHARELQVSEKILVVDDEVKIVRVVRAYLEREASGGGAYDGKEALEVARRENPTWWCWI